MGELFPGQKLRHDGGQDSDGQGYRPEADVDLDKGVVRLRRAAEPATVPPCDGEEVDGG